MRVNDSHTHLVDPTLGAIPDGTLLVASALPVTSFTPSSAQLLLVGADSEPGRSQPRRRDTRMSEVTSDSKVDWVIKKSFGKDKVR